MIDYRETLIWLLLYALIFLRLYALMGVFHFLLLVATGVVALVLVAAPSTSDRRWRLVAHNIH
jgi:hypothetical protein